MLTNFGFKAWVCSGLWVLLPLLPLNNAWCVSQASGQNTTFSPNMGLSGLCSAAGFVPSEINPPPDFGASEEKRFAASWQLSVRAFISLRGKKTPTGARNLGKLLQRAHDHERFLCPFGVWQQNWKWQGYMVETAFSLIIFLAVSVPTKRENGAANT